MSESRGDSPRRSNGRGADPDKVAAFAAANYTALRRLSERHAGADERTPRDLDDLRRARR